jgi:hypothetical protein
MDGTIDAIAQKAMSIAMLNLFQHLTFTVEN